MGAIQITRLDWKDSIRMVREVMDMGINWFDTAERAAEGGGKGYRRAGNETLRRGTDHRCRAV